MGAATESGCDSFFVIAVLVFVVVIVDVILVFVVVKLLFTEFKAGLAIASSS